MHRPTPLTTLVLLLGAAASGCAPKDTEPAQATPSGSAGSEETAESERRISMAAHGTRLEALRSNAEQIAARAEHADARVRVAHILVAFEGAARSPVVGRSRAQAEDRAAEILHRVSEGEDFLAVMKETSDDPGPGVYGMVLSEPTAGFYPRSQMAPAFGDVAWRLAVGEVGVAPHDPEQSPFGWHLIKRLE